MARKSDQRAAQLLHVAALHSVVLLLPDGDAGNQVRNWQPVCMETGASEAMRYNQTGLVRAQLQSW